MRLILAILALTGAGPAAQGEDELREALRKAAQYESYSFTIETTVEGLPKGKGADTPAVTGKFHRDVGTVASAGPIRIVKVGDAIAYNSGDGWKKFEKPPKGEGPDREKKERRRKEGDKKDEGKEGGEEGTGKDDGGINQDEEGNRDEGQDPKEGEGKDNGKKQERGKDAKEPRPDRPPREVATLKEPHVELGLIGRGIDHVEDIEETGDGTIYTAALSEQAAARLSPFGNKARRGEGSVSGSLKVWTDAAGAVVKYEVTVEAAVAAREQERALRSTRTVSLGGIDGTEVEIPEEAREALGK